MSADEYDSCTCPDEPGFTTMGCPVHDATRTTWSGTAECPRPVDEELEQASIRVDDEIAAIRGALVSTSPSGMSMQTAHGSRLTPARRRAGRAYTDEPRSTRTSSQVATR